MADQSQILSALRDPSLASLSDADAAAALNAPIRTPKASPVTSTTLGSVWGVSAAATLKATLRAMIAAGGANGALADYVLGVLEGAGFDASNTDAQATAQQFVTAGVITQDQFFAAFFDTAYRCGTPDVTTQQVTAARATLVLEQAAQDLRRDWGGVYNRGVGLIDAGVVSGTLPTLDTLRGA